MGKECGARSHRNEKKERRRRIESVSHGVLLDLYKRTKERKKKTKPQSPPPGKREGKREGERKSGGGPNGSNERKK